MLTVSVVKYLISNNFLLFFDIITSSLQSSLQEHKKERTKNIEFTEISILNFIRWIKWSIDNHDSDLIAIGDEQLKLSSIRTFQFPQANDARETFHYQNRIETLKSATCDPRLNKSLSFICLEIISSDKMLCIVKSSCSVYEILRYWVIE